MSYNPSNLTAAERKALADFQKLCEDIRIATPVTANETEGEKAARIARLERNIKDWCAYHLPMMRPLAPKQVRELNKIIREKDYFGWWQWFRGSGKTTSLVEMLCLYLLAIGELKFLVLVCATDEAAARWLSNLQAHLQHNQRFIADYGVQMRHGSWTDGEFTTASGATFLGMGMGQKPRGLNKGGRRPDTIICSDLDSKELSKNPARVREMKNWIMEELMGTFDPSATIQRFIYDNNLFSDVSIGGLLKEDHPELYITRLDIVDKDGNPTLPHMTREMVDKIRRRRGYRAFMRECMNTPVEEGAVFAHDWMRWLKRLPWQQYEYLGVYCDPSLKHTPTADYKALVLVARKGKDVHVLRAFCRQASLAVMVGWHYDLAESLPKDVVCYHDIEGGFAQDQLLDEYVREGLRRNWQLPIRSDGERKADKFSRIEAMSALFERGMVWFDESQKDDPDMKTGMKQILAFERGSRAHDDFPDALEGAIRKLNQRGGRPGWDAGASAPRTHRRRI